MKDIIIKGFEDTNNRTVLLCDEINSITAATVKKDFINIINKDLYTFNDNYTELCSLNKEIANTYARTVEFPPIYFDINCPGGRVYDGTGYNIIDSKGKELSLNWFQGIVPFSDGMAKVSWVDGTVNYIDTTGNLAWSEWKKDTPSLLTIAENENTVEA